MFDLGKYNSLFQPKFKSPTLLFQSDDWGFNRLGDAASHKIWLKTANHKFSTIQLVDSLENSEDLNCLAEVLIKHVDSKGNNPCFTMNFVLSNPDFNKIEESEFSKYYRISLAESYKQIWSETETITLLKKFNKKGIFDIQYHGLDHLRWKLWLTALIEKDTNSIIAFKRGICGMNSTKLYSNRSNFMAPFDSFGEEQEIYLNDAKYGISEFERVFGFKPISFIAPGYIWSERVENQFFSSGISSFQGLPKQILPATLGVKYKSKRRIINNGRSYSYTLRNCYFEPVENKNRDYVAECLNRMQFFFRWGIPVVINTHRFNYVSGYSKENKEHGLRELDRLLTAVIKHWPSITFLSTHDYVIKIKQ